MSDQTKTTCRTYMIREIDAALVLLEQRGGVGLGVGVLGVMALGCINEAIRHLRDARANLVFQNGEAAWK